MNVSHKCRCYGLIDLACLPAAVNQTRTCAISLSTASEESTAERTMHLREDLVAGIYKLQEIKDGSSLDYIGEFDVNEEDEITNLGKKYENIKLTVIDYKEKSNNT